MAEEVAISYRPC